MILKNLSHSNLTELANHKFWVTRTARISVTLYAKIGTQLNVYSYYNCFTEVDLTAYNLNVDTEQFILSAAHQKTDLIDRWSS